MSRRFNKRLLCCFRLTTSHTEGWEVNKGKTHQRQETLWTPPCLLWLSNPQSVQSRAVTGWDVSAFVCHTPGRPLWVTAQSQRRDCWEVSGGRRRAHLPTCIMERLPSAAALWLSALLGESLPLCKNPIRHCARPVCRLLLTVREQRRHPQTLYKPPPHCRGRTVVWSKRGGICVKISPAAERSS